VRNYTADYRRENDPVAEWLEACCEFDPVAITAAGELRASYEAWAERNGEKAISAKALGAALRGRGCVSKPTKRQRNWQGIALAEGDG